MNQTTPKNVITSNNSVSSSSQIRHSHLKPPQAESRVPSFLQQTRVSLTVPKHDNDLPDYTNSPFVLSDEQRNMRSLTQILGVSSLDGSYTSTFANPGLMRKETLTARSGHKPTLILGQRGRNSTTEAIDIFQSNQAKTHERRFEKIKNFLDDKWVNLYFILLTLYALFGQDFGVLVTPASWQTAFDVINLISVASFLVEMTLTFISDKDYRWDFFFWLDLISTASILLDLSFIPTSAFQTQADSTQIARAGRVSKIGARAGRVVKIIQLSRISKFYKQVKESEMIGISNAQSHSIQSLTNLVGNIAKFKRQKSGISPSDVRGSLDFSKRKPTVKLSTFRTKDGDTEEEKTFLTKMQTLNNGPRLSKFAVHRKHSDTIFHRTKLEALKTLKTPFSQAQSKESPSQEYNAPKESRVGKKFSDTTTKKVIFIILFMLLLVPLMSSDSWSSTVTSYVADVDFIEDCWRNETIDNADINALILDVIDRRKNEISPIIFFQMPLPNNTVVYETKPHYSKLRSTEVVIIETDEFPGMLVAVSLSRTNQVLAATNIARTTFMCLLLGFGSWLFSKDANKLVLRPLERMTEKVNRMAISPLSVKREGLMDETQQKETALLENAITKIGTLLALGFGDAGAGIIAQNIAHAGDVNPMLSGEKIMAIFGFCDIRNFTDATEVLQEDVMVFVNSIADIVHDKVDKYGGSANKNIGDAFLLVWKFPDSEVEEMDEILQLKNTDLVSGLSDLSLFSFLKIFAKINQSPVLRKYRTNPKLLERLPNYRVKMGFGLHVGWAIEGAIGSEYKIDASYLSPNVNIASRLEAATKQYGVPLLISSDLYVLFSEEIQKLCRKLDVVTVKGSQVPITLYTVDLSSDDLRDKNPSKRSKKERVSRHETKKVKLLEMIWEGKLSTHLLFEKDKDVKVLVRDGQLQEFRSLWEEGLEAYINGNWKRARLMFDRCLVTKENDGPSHTLLNYMKGFDYIAPESWKGYRELTEK